MIAGLLLLLLATHGESLVTWRSGEAAGDDRPLPVGSIQKPFVAKAWALAHPGDKPPVLCCDGTGCWRHSGHGRLSLERAIAVSCNAYFRQLAADTRPDILESTLADEGFRVPPALTPEGALGGGGREEACVIRPSALLAAYVRLTRVPWVRGEDVRRLVLAGLRESAIDGTAAGIGRRGVWAKTGTVPALDGRPLATSGWAISVDDAGGAILGLLPHGTGREAAKALVAPPEKSLAAPSGLVRVRLFGTLHPSHLRARNIGHASVLTSRGFVGPGASLRLEPGDRLESALWETTLGNGLVRQIAGALVCGGDREGHLDLVAEVSPVEYVNGIILAELGGVSDARKVDLGATVLRFLGDGPRHGAVDVCDSTHCAWFLGRGPRVQWTTPTLPVLFGLPGPVVDDATWSQILASAKEPGPHHWTGHCGGTPLSAHFVWGSGDRSVLWCPRHHGTTSPWTRTWSDAALERAFGQPVRTLAVTEVDGVWTLRIAGRDLLYDEAHRKLARVLGWDALPSPADRAVRVSEGWEIQGVGAGHRVGLCLSD